MRKSIIRTTVEEQLIRICEALPNQKTISYKKGASHGYDYIWRFIKEKKDFGVRMYKDVWSSLERNERAIYEGILLLANPKYNKSVFPYVSKFTATVAEIAKKSKVSTSTFYRHIIGLEKKGLVKRKKEKGDSVYTYWVSHELNTFEYKPKLKVI